MKGGQILTYIALALAAVGILIVAGIISPFPSSTVCIGLLLFGQCYGYYSNVSSGNNFILGIILIGAAAFVFLLSRRHGGR